MASYAFIYNGVNLSYLASVRAVETTVLPPRENHAITIWERNGSIYNSYRYGERDIVVTFLVRATKRDFDRNSNIMQIRLDTLRSVFRVTEPKPLYLGDTSKYILAVPEGDFKMTELRHDCYECEIQFVCHNPEYYASSVKASNNRASSTYGMRNSSNNNNIEVYNGGNASAYPIINVNINSTTSFVQIENTTNGNKFLLGSYPTVGTLIEDSTKSVFSDNMEDYNLWLGSRGYIDHSRNEVGGSPIITSDGSGIMIGNPAPGSLLWRGIGADREIDEPTKDFEVRTKMRFNSYGINGDPTNPQYIDEGNRYGGEKTYFYKVVAPSVPIKSSPDKYGTIIGTYNKGDEVHDTVPASGGYVQVEGGYCEAIYMKKYISDTSETDAAMNVATKEEIGLMSRPSDDSDSILLATIDGGTPLRVHRYEENGYYKLYIPYNGKVGYIDSSKVEQVYDYPVDYPESEIIVSDDNKTGVCEVYGHDRYGKRIFKLCLSDENEYYSLISPTIYVGSDLALEDTSVSSNNSSNNIDEYNVAYDALSESSCDWSNFFGELGIRRVDNMWQAWVYKIEDGVTVKKLELKEQAISGAPTEDLYYITIYIGAQESGNMCGMSITDIQVDRINNIPISVNAAPFKQGDEIKIDCYNSKVYLNNKPYNDIDMNSQFIELLTGNNVLKATSDKSDMLVTVLFNERYL